MSRVPTGISTPSMPRMARAMRWARGTPRRRMPMRARCLVPLLALGLTAGAQAQTQKPATVAKAPARPKEAGAKPKLVVMLVVDQMRGDYVDKFLGQWTGGLKRLVEEGAWFRDAAYPYAATE